MHIIILGSLFEFGFAERKNGGLSFISFCLNTTFLERIFSEQPVCRLMNDIKSENRKTKTTHSSATLAQHSKDNHDHM